MNPKKRLKRYAKKFMIGRDFQLFDKLVFYLSNKKSSGWVLGNKLRAFLHGKNKKISKEEIIFVGGFPRSGTSLLKVLLEQHPEIIGTTIEVNVFQDIKDRDILEKEFEFSKDEMKKLDINEKDLVKFTEKVLDLFKKKKGDKIVLLKQPKYLFFIEKLFKHYPNAKFIHIIRDPRDATMSQKYFLLPPGRESWPYDWCCRQYVTFINKGKKYRNDSRYMEIKYEDLIEDTYSKVKEIYDFLGLKQITKKRVMSYPKSESAKKFHTHPKVSEPIDKSQKNKWLNKMSKKDKIIFEKILGKKFRELGYHNY